MAINYDRIIVSGDEILFQGQPVAKITVPNSTVRERFEDLLKAPMTEDEVETFGQSRYEEGYEDGSCSAQDDG